MSDEQKKVVVNTGATVIAIGAISKVSAGAIKGVGGMVEAVGNIQKKHFQPAEHWRSLHRH